MRANWLKSLDGWRLLTGNSADGPALAQLHTCKEQRKALASYGKSSFHTGWTGVYLPRHFWTK